MTGREASWHPGDGVPIRSTVGRPTLWWHGPLVHVTAIAPYRVFRNPALETAAQRTAYLTRFDDRCPHG